MDEVVTGPVGNGLKQIVDINPAAGVLIGVLLAAIVFLWRELVKERAAKDKAMAAHLEDKNEQIAEAKEERKVWERLMDRMEAREGK